MQEEKERRSQAWILLSPPELWEVLIKRRMLNTADFLRASVDHPTENMPRAAVLAPDTRRLSSEGSHRLMTPELQAREQELNLKNEERLRIRQAICHWKEW